ncbi:nucleotidyltransferase family protein [Novosphingobium sp. G106]|uniref:nucleotidyltransferase family protein n=1 Tax=Novosphingobium sp. G106 TaxID=2849500 RepID=UPI001C2DB8E2|nr:nucleotidyltransferase family protein [Novosphingobium sp. G106]MBV1690916.1 nucleotidyltransferase family protein [Novosphingobium sp. G106]
MTFVSLVLAAGSARRFGSDKLSAEFRGEPLVHHAIRVARAAPVARVIVVCSDKLAVGEWLGEPPVETVRIASNALSASLQAGIAAAGSASGAFIFLGDMPLIPPDVAGDLAEALGDHFAAVPRHAGKNGHPVLLSARAFPEISGLTGDEGAGRLLKQRSDIAFIDVTEDTILLDVDRAEDLARLENR